MNENPTPEDDARAQRNAFLRKAAITTALIFGVAGGGYGVAAATTEEPAPPLPDSTERDDTGTTSFTL
jgi:hypothetical protein